MFCWKKASYNIQNKQNSKMKEKNIEPVLQRNTRLKSLRKKKPEDKKNSLTITFSSNLKAKK